MCPLVFHRSKKYWKSCSGVQFFATPWTITCQVPLSMGFSRQEYWSGLPYPPPGDFPNLRKEPRSPTLQVDSLPSEPPGKPKNTGVGSLSFSRGSSQPRNWIKVSCIAGGFFTNWVIWEVLPVLKHKEQDFLCQTLDPKHPLVHLLGTRHILRFNLAWRY